MGEYDQYIEHYPRGMKVHVGIPVPGESVFQDWAIIAGVDEDLVELQLSRDVLPAGVRLTIGTILDIRGGKDENAYSCRGIIVSEGVQRTILLRFIGEIVSDELREYYRIDAFLPIKYYLAGTTSEYVLKQDWQAKRQARAEAERERREQEKKPWQRLMLPQEGRPHGETQEVDEEPFADVLAEEDALPDDTGDHSWDDVIPLAANISGGGLRILLHHEVKVDALIMLEIFVPTEPQPKIVDAVGKVVLCAQNYAATKQTQRDSYNTGIEFLCIDERDRDTIVSYIANVQLKRIRQLREQYLGRRETAEEEALSDAERLRLKIVQLLVSAIVLGFLVWSVIYFNRYSENRPQSEIERIFDQGFMKYLKKIGKGSPTNTQD